MTITVKVVPNASKNKIEQLSDTEYKAWVTNSTRNNLANNSVTKLLAQELELPNSQVILIKGAKFRQKVFLIRN